MSWLPSNYSLNSIKDQFSNLAGELLNEIRDEKANSNDEDDTAISALNYGGSTSEKTSSNRFESKIICDFKSQIQSLQNEKGDLISSLEQLDLDNQENVEKLVRFKDDLQADLQKSKNDFDNLKKEYDKLKDWSGSSESIDELGRLNSGLEQEVVVLKTTLESSKIDYEKLLQSNMILRIQIDENSKSLDDETISQDNYRKLESILREYEKRVRNYEVELQELQKSTSNSMEGKNAEAESLQNVVESSNKIIESKNGIINDLELANLDLKKKLEHCQVEIKNLREINEKDSDLVEEKILELKDESEKLHVVEEEKIILEKQIKEELQIFEDFRRKHDGKILDFEKQIEKLLIDRNEMENENLDHQKSFVALNEEIRNLTDLQKEYLSSFEAVYNKCFDSSEDSNESSEISSKFNKITNYLTDFQLNQSELQNNVSQLSDQNHKSLQEIEKLTRNSSTLKQEIVNKNIEFEDFESEYNELLKSNDLMLAELNLLKSNNLVTISETNEDNMLQLESDLENANTKIKELEVILDGEKSRPQSSEPFEMLQKSFDEVNVENVDLQKTLDKCKLDYENLDYKCNEQKAQIEALQEDSLNIDKAKFCMEEENFILVSKLQELGEAYLKVSNELVDVRSVAVEDVKHMQEKLHSNKMVETSLRLQNDLLAKEIVQLKDNIIIVDLQQKLDNVSLQNEEMTKSIASFIEEKENLECKLIKLNDEQDTGISTKELADFKQKYVSSEQQLANLNKNREELITALNSKHEESLKYYQEIQNLQQKLHEKSAIHTLAIAKINSLDDHQLNEKCREIEKLTDQNDFLKDKCDKMTNTLMHEQSSARKQLMDANEHEQSLAKELERLRQHLLEVEEIYTKELLVAEQKTAEMQSKVNAVEQREKNSNNVYTSVSIRANQQVETLHTQLQLVTNQRDEIRNKLSDNEDQINKQAAALTNLQLVLQHFQKDKQQDVHNETDRIRRQIAGEKSAQVELQKEINSLKQQLKESKEGLQAAARLTDQLEEANKSWTNMNNELIKLRSKLNETEKKYEDTISQPDAKVDKSLIKNLIIGLISSNNNLTKDQQQILKIIGTVLDFSQQESDKLELNKNLQSSWISAILNPAHPGQKMSQESLSLAFVKFLENESKPINLPNLLAENATEKAAQNNAKATILNEMVLPTFNDYGQRSSSSILKDVLKEHPNSSC